MIAFTLPASNRGTGDGRGNAWNSNYVAATLSGGGHPGSNMPGRHHEDDENLIPTLSFGAHPGGLTGREAENGTLLVANGLRASDGHHGHSSPRGDGADNLIAFSNRGNATTGAIPMAGGAAGVRRLTPLECERLMGWPDDHTRWAADGREIPDSHRYRLCGNGVVSTVSEWIGHRLMAVGAVV